MKIDVPKKKTFTLRREDWTKIGDRAGWLRVIRADAIEGMTRQDWERIGKRNGWTHEPVTASAAPDVLTGSASVSAPVMAPEVSVQAASPANRYNFTVKRDASGRICSIEATSLG